MTRVKICGITNLEDARTAVELGADALGFVFAEMSPRKITPAAAAEIIRRLPPFLTVVGLFMDEMPETVERISRDCRLDALDCLLCLCVIPGSMASISKRRVGAAAALTTNVVVTVGYTTWGYWGRFEWNLYAPEWWQGWWILILLASRAAMIALLSWAAASVAMYVCVAWWKDRHG